MCYFLTATNWKSSDYWLGCGGGALVHADRPAEGFSLGDEGWFGWGFGAGVWVSAVVVPHGLDVAATAHTSAGDLPTTVGRTTTTPVIWGHLQDTWFAVSLAFTYENDEGWGCFDVIYIDTLDNIGSFFKSFERIGWENDSLTQQNSHLFLTWMYLCFWMNQLGEWLNDSIIKTVTCFVPEWIRVLK